MIKRTDLARRTNPEENKLRLYQSYLSVFPDARMNQAAFSLIRKTLPS